MTPPDERANSPQSQLGSSDHDGVDETISQDLQRFVEMIPKVELHAHLNGCIRESTLFELAAERNVTLSSHHYDLRACPTENSNCGGDYMYNLKPRSLLDCFEMFAEIPSCVNDLVSLARITSEALDDFAQHHVAYIELRSTPKCLLWKNGDAARAMKRDYIETVLSTMQSFELAEAKRYEREKEIETGCRLALVPRFIVSIDRSGTIQEAIENTQLAIDLFQSGSPYVVGVDLGGNPTKNDFSEFVPALRMARDAGLNVTVHCGEVPCGEGLERSNATLQKAYKEMQAVLSFAPDRLGHSLLLPKSLRSVLDQSMIPVECCPTSNVMTLELATHLDGNLVQGLKRHPQLGHWLDTNYPLSVSTDDSGVFNTDASKELLLLATAWNLDKSRLQQIVLQSLEHGFCNVGTKSRLKSLFVDRIREISIG